MKIQILDPHGEVFGHVDYIHYTRSRISLKGWACDRRNGIPADFILIATPDDTVIRIARPSVEREDVSRESPLCGWEVDIPDNLEVYQVYACFSHDQVGYRIYSLESRQYRVQGDQTSIREEKRAITEMIQELYNRHPGRSDDYRGPTDRETSISRDDIHLIAYFLTQFHPVPENDDWWGTGFTEWRNVTKTLPLFKGHYQPHLPSDLGFYDLRLRDVLVEQVNLARKYGISGFCFYYYWFDGRRILETPLNNFLDHEEIDFPFCICWANENWTRRWDGHDEDILLEHTYSDDTNLRFIRDLIPVITHKNYIRVDGKPLIIVYRSLNVPDPLEMTRIWREYCREEGMGEIFLAAAKTRGFDQDPREIGFDAVVEFPPHGTDAEIIQQKNAMRACEATIYSYESILQRFRMEDHPYPYFYTVFPSWDNTPRRARYQQVYHGSTPGLYKEWLKTVINFTMKHHPPGKRFVFINAWNEWAEGAHLEPDIRHGHAYLAATQEAVEECGKEQESRNVHADGR